MDSRHEEVRVNVEDDRLSSLPDDLIHKILSFIGIKHAIKTSVLSSRWRYIWTIMPCLNILSEDLHMFPNLSAIVTHILSCRNNEIEVSSVKLTLRGIINGSIVKRILDYAFSHNVQQLNIKCLFGNTIKFPPSLFSSQSLRHLTLDRYIYEHSSTTPLTWELPVLATLNLHSVTLFGDDSAALFSNCANLKNLTLKNCRLEGMDSFKICHDGLTSLTLEDGCKYVNVNVNVVTPQLKNLTVKFWGRLHLISAPSLISLNYKDYGYDYDTYLDDDDDDDDDNDDDAYHPEPLQLSTELSHLEKVDICIECPCDSKEYARKIFTLLQKLHSVKFLTLNLELVKHLAFYVELIAHQPSPFVNLKSLKIYPLDVTPVEHTHTQRKVTISAKVKNYLLDGSPSATFTMVSYEEIRAVINVTVARNLLGELQALLNKWKEKSETNTTHMNQEIATVHEQVEVENHVAQPKDMKMVRYVGERMTRIKRYWEDLCEQVENGFLIASRIMSMLQKIEGVVTKVHASHRDELQTRLSSLCLEAETLMDSRMDQMMIHCNKKPRRANVFLNELSTSSHPSS